MDSIERLTRMFEEFPGIGPRQARRFVQFLLTERQSFRADLADTVRQLASQTSQCPMCFRWFVKNGNSSGLCSICSNPSRDRGLLFVTEKEADIENVERSGFKGLYFCLGGTIPLASDEPSKYVRVKELLKRLETDGSEGVLAEVILGLSATTEGDHTRLILQEKMLPLSDNHKFKISSLGRGLSTGSELEYADPDTIASALSTRG